MKLNNEYSFGYVPTIQTPRSRFLMHKNIRTTFNAGELIPIYVNPLIQPGDTIKAKGTVVIRMSTPLNPTMDNAFFDLRAFFCPHRLSWEHFKAFMGENETGSWAVSANYSIPQIKPYTSASLGAQTKIEKGDILQYMGWPIGFPKSLNTPPSLANAKGGMALPVRSYLRVWNDWYRDENFCPPIYVSTGDQDCTPTTTAQYQWGQYGAHQGYVPKKCAPVYKFKDMYNSCLPEPQKGTPITLPIGQSAPVLGTGETMSFEAATKGVSDSTKRNLGYDGTTNTLYGGTGTPSNPLSLNTDGSKSGVFADLSNAVAATINAQRIAFAAQRILEACARTGTRFNEIISGIWGVKGVHSAVLQRTEYLGGYRLPINVTQVVQTSESGNTSPQGHTAAYSLTVDNQHIFSKSFEEWGTLIFCVCVRTEHSYSQGLEMFWDKKDKFDFYWPQLAFLGEQAIKNKYIYADGSANDEEVFGYNERWVEYRTENNLNTGAFSPDYTQSLDIWHYGDDYSALPVLSDAWRRETKDNIDRTLAVSSATEDQFIMDSRFEFDKTSAIPLRSIPGLLDHF